MYKDYAFIESVTPLTMLRLFDCQLNIRLCRKSFTKPCYELINTFPGRNTIISRNTDKLKRTNNWQVFVITVCVKIANLNRFFRITPKGLFTFNTWCYNYVRLFPSHTRLRKFRSLPHCKTKTRYNRITRITYSKITVSSRRRKPRTQCFRTGRG